MPNEMEYKILQASTVSEIERATASAMDSGWQLASPISEFKGVLYREIIRPKQEALDRRRADEEERKAAADRFQQKVSDMDPEVRDLLDINGINLVCIDGKLFTYIGEKVIDGISPVAVLNALKNSKHFPIGADEKKILQAIEGVL